MTVLSMNEVGCMKLGEGTLFTFKFIRSKYTVRKEVFNEISYYDRLCWYLMIGGYYVEAFRILTKRIEKKKPTTIT